MGALCELPGLLRDLGHDPAPILAAAGLTASSLDSPDHRITYPALGRLMACSVRLTGRSDLGLLTGRLWTLGHMGLVGELMKHSATVGDALRILVFNHRLNSEGAAVFLFESGDLAALGYAVHQPRVEGLEHIYDAVLACGLNLIRELLGAQWAPHKVVLARTHPKDSRPYLAAFQVRPEFDSDHSAIYLPRSLLDQPVSGADPGTRRQLEARVAQMTETDILLRVHRAIRLLLVDGQCSGEEVARRLHMHRRTLHRRLEAEGTSFQKILDGVRWDIARQLLGSTRLSLGEIAAATAYVDISSFVRAFHRWSGTTPEKWRKDRRG